MKLAPVLTAFVRSAALATMALGGSPVRAAGPVKFQIPAARDERAGNMSFEWSLRNKALFGPRVGLSDKAREQSGAEWSPRTAGLNGYAAISFGFYRKRLVNAQSRPSATVLDHRIVLSRFTVSRHRINVRLTIAF